MGSWRLRCLQARRPYISRLVACDRRRVHRLVTKPKRSWGLCRSHRTTVPNTTQDRTRQTGPTPTPTTPLWTKVGWCGRLQQPRRKQQSHRSSRKCSEGWVACTHDSWESLARKPVHRAKRREHPMGNSLRTGLPTSHQRINRTYSAAARKSAGPQVSWLRSASSPAKPLQTPEADRRDYNWPS